jgi:hypothetical protein
MTYSSHVIPMIVILTLLVAAVAGTGDTAGIEPASADDLIALAESAAPPEIAREATIMDMDGNVLREGTNEWFCVAAEGAPMCGDAQWMTWMDAYMNQREETGVTALGFSYMLQGDTGASNIDPYAEGPTEDNEWVITGPHLMMIVPNPALLEGIPTDPKSGGPYVMWRDTPYAHVMVPIYEDDVEMPYREDR